MWNEPDTMSTIKNRQSPEAHEGKSAPSAPFGRRVIVGLAGALFEAYYRMRLGFSVKPTQKLLGRGDIRSRLVRALDYLSGISEEGEPAFNRKADLSDQLAKRREQIRTKWTVYYSARPVSSDHHEELTRWDLLGVYPDVSFISLFDLSRHFDCFSDAIQKEYHRGRASGTLTAIEGKEGKSFFALLKRVCELQLEWATKLFLLPASPPTKTGMYDDLFGFSGQLLSGLVLISEFIDFSSPDATLHPNYNIRFKESFIRHFEGLCTSGATFADLFFLHGAVCRFWSIKIGMRDRDGLLLSFETKSKCSAFLKLLKDKSVCDVVLVALQHNPISNLLLGPLLSDTGLVQQADGDPTARFDKIFESALSDETLFWLANYASSLLTSPYGNIRHDRHGTKAMGCSIESKEDAPRLGAKLSELKSYIRRSLFCRRILKVASLINPPKEGKEDELTEPPRPFLQSFYKLLLGEWLQERDRKVFPPHPLPPLNHPLIPIRVRIAHFSKDEKESASHNEILSSLGKGESFGDLAIKHSDEYLVRASKGDRGWIKRGELPASLERALFSFPADAEPFYTKADGKYQYFLIHERENSSRESLLERIALWAQVDKALRDATTALFAPLHSLMSDPRAHNLAYFEDLSGLYREAQFCLQLIAGADKPFHSIQGNFYHVDDIARNP
jgi:hypothetical protein